ncbi:MAG: DUF1801 domain-containing protein [Anaerolineales bacterium]|nr:DUF1801 domain-containing protein [Anaerolineales bacterium]
MAESPKTVSEYIRTFPPATQQLLQAIRTTIQDAVPEAQEAISYRIAAFTVGGKYLMYFAGHSKHVAVYPIPPLPASTQKQIEPYQASKGTLRFALDKPLPLALIRKLALAHRKRIKETVKK